MEISLIKEMRGGTMYDVDPVLKLYKLFAKVTFCEELEFP